VLFSSSSVCLICRFVSLRLFCLRIRLPICLFSRNVYYFLSFMWKTFGFPWFSSPRHLHLHLPAKFCLISVSSSLHPISCCPSSFEVCAVVLVSLNIDSIL
jgi:hypothetical protein